MSLFAIGDLHLSLGTDKPMDIFGGWDDYVNRLKDNWQRVVKKDDIVVVPGDISWATKLNETYKDFEFINKLNGTKIISKGNHDYWWTTMNKMEKYLVESGFDTIKIMHNNHFVYENIGICGSRGWISDNGEPADKKVLDREAGRLSLSIESALKENLKPVVFLHYPPVFLNSRNEEMLEVLYKYKIKSCFYGHLHGRAKDNAVNGMYDGINYHLISSDFLQFCPIEISKIVQSDNL